MTAPRNPGTGRYGRATTATQLREDKRLADNIRLMLARKKLTQEDLGTYLGYADKSGISRAFSSPHRLRSEIIKIGEYLECDPSALMSGTAIAAEPEALEPMAKRAATEVRESLLFRCFHTVDVEGKLAMPPACALWDIPASEDNHLRVSHQTYLCGPPKANPDQGDLVIAQTKDGRRWVRIYSKDARNPSAVILGAFLPGDQPLQVEEGELEDLRIVAGTANLGSLS